MSHDNGPWQSELVTEWWLGIRPSLPEPALTSLNEQTWWNIKTHPSSNSGRCSRGIGHCQLDVFLWSQSTEDQPCYYWANLTVIVTWQTVLCCIWSIVIYIIDAEGERHCAIYSWRIDPLYSNTISYRSVVIFLEENNCFDLAALTTSLIR